MMMEIENDINEQVVIQKPAYISQYNFNKLNDPEFLKSLNLGVKKVGEPNYENNNSKINEQKCIKY